MNIQNTLAHQGKRAWRSRYLLLMILFPMVYLYLFNYVPMYGAQIAFRDYNPFLGVLGSPFVGLKHFRDFFSSIYFGRLLRNTLTISLVQLLLTFPAAVILSLMINEVQNRYLKKTVQTIVYLPHFISTVVVVGIVMGVLSPGAGIVNRIINALGGQTVMFFNEPKYFPFIIAGSELWQNTGWGTVVYLAAITSIDPGLYEASVMDGASRFKQMLHITLPSLIPTIVVLFILRMGSLFSVGYQKILLMYNPTIYETADIIPTFVYRRGIGGQEYSYGTAVDLFNSAMNLVLLLTFNRIMRRVSETSLW